MGSIPIPHCFLTPSVEGAGRPRILVAEPGAEGFRTLHVPLGHGAGQDPDSLMEEGE